MPTARRVILWRTKHDPRTFVERLDFVTAAGNVDRGHTIGIFARHGRQAGGREPASRRDAGCSGTPPGSPCRRTRDAGNPPPTDEELRVLRAIDPGGVVRSEFA